VILRFETKFDRWLVLVLGLSAIATCVVVPAARFLAPGSHPAPFWLSFMPLAIWLIVLPCMLPQYYVVRDDGLFVRQGWKKSLIPYAALIEIQSTSDARSAAVFSTDRILLVTQDGKRFLIAVAEEERFLAELAKRCPQLEQRPFGLGIPLSPSSTI
jgi:hypothetical protein